MTDTTKLAEKAAKFLGFETWSQFNEWCFAPCGDRRIIKPEHFFSSDIAPILAHLAKREMEKQDKFLSYSTYINQVNKDDPKLIHVYRYAGYDGGSDENEYKALWLAIEATGVLDE